MTRKKSFRKADFLNSPIAFKEDIGQKGRWKEWFGNDNPLILELGCGKGEMSIGLAKIKPNHNFMGIDIKSDRLWVATQEVEAFGLKNVCFQRLDISRLSEFFASGEVSGLWITFPDPQPKKGRAKRRLTHHNFIKEYQKVIKPGGVIEFKTDNLALFDWTLEHYAEIGIKIDAFTHDLYNSDLLSEETGIPTTYEKRFRDMGEKINYLRFRLP